MGEKGPEAILPLKRSSDGRLGVASPRTAAPGINVTFNVQAADAASFSKIRRSDQHNARACCQPRPPWILTELNLMDTTQSFHEIRFPTGLALGATGGTRAPNRNCKPWALVRNNGMPDGHIRVGVTTQVTD